MDDNIFSKNKFWFDFFIIFVIGSIFIGIFETIAYDKIYSFQLATKEQPSFFIRLIIFAPGITKFICLSFVIYSLWILYKDISIHTICKTLELLKSTYYHRIMRAPEKK